MAFGKLTEPPKVGASLEKKWSVKSLTISDPNMPLTLTTLPSAETNIPATSRNEKLKLCYIKLDTSHEVFKFQYVPETFSIKRSASYAENKSPSMGYPHYTFTGGEGSEISIELFINDDTYNKISQEEIDKYGMFASKRRQSKYMATLQFLHELVPSAINTRVDAPPSFIFVYGVIAYHCVLQDFEYKIERSNSEGIPVMGHITLTMKVIV